MVTTLHATISYSVNAGEFRCVRYSRLPTIIVWVDSHGHYAHTDIVKDQLMI